MGRLAAVTQRYVSLLVYASSHPLVGVVRKSPVSGWVPNLYDSLDLLFVPVPPALLLFRQQHFLALRSLDPYPPKLRSEALALLSDMSQNTSGGVHQRKSVEKPVARPAPPERVPSALQTELTAWLGKGLPAEQHPLGAPKHGGAMQAARIVGFGVYFFGSCFFIHMAQLMGAPLYFVDRVWFDACMALTKQYFGLLVTTMTQWWSPTVIRISGDKSMKGLIKQDKNGMLQMDFGERVVLMANHQLYTDWLYLWWISYTNVSPMHGHIYIILKESLKYVPIIGPAMMLYGFIFMARKWSSDQERMRYRLKKLCTPRRAPGTPQSSKSTLDPMWLLIFPEGTNISANTRASSVKYSAKSGIPDMKHQLLPRSTGLQFCLQQLGTTVEYLYDCTIGYEGIPDGCYGQDVFTLRSVYFQGRPPASVNMHWRRYAVSSLPLDDHDAMYEWTMQRWREKDELMEHFKKHGKFPADKDAVEIENGPTEKEWKTAYINTEVKPRMPLEFLQMFAPVAAAALIGRILVQLADRLFGK
nr:putative acyltransferase [Quercus suber]